MTVKFDDVDLVLVHVVQNVIRLVRKTRPGKLVRVCELEFSDPHGKHQFVIRGKEVIQNGSLQPIGGHIRCICSDVMWWNAAISGEVYLQDLGKCPFRTKRTGRGSLVVEVKKETTAVYGYTTVGEFEI